MCGFYPPSVQAAVPSSFSASSSYRLVPGLRLNSFDHRIFFADNTSNTFSWQSSRNKTHCPQLASTCRGLGISAAETPIRIKTSSVNNACFTEQKETSRVYASYTIAPHRVIALPASDNSSTIAYILVIPPTSSCSFLS